MSCIKKSSLFHVMGFTFLLVYLFFPSHGFPQPESKWFKPNFIKSLQINNPTKLSTPADLVVKALSKTQVQLSWTDTSNDESGFGIDYRVGAGNWQILGWVGTNQTTAIHDGVDPCLNYCYRVYAYTSNSQSDYSNMACLIPGDPETPTDLFAYGLSTTSIMVQWTDNSNNENGFGIDYSVDSGNWQSLAYVGPNVTSYTHTGLNGKSTYCYRVYAYGDCGFTSDYSNSYCTIPKLFVPTAPSNLYIDQMSNSGVRLLWQDNSYNEKGFGLDYQLNNESWAVLGFTGPNTNTYLDNYLSGGQSYKFRVYAYNEAGHSNYSNVAVITTQSDSYLRVSFITSDDSSRFAYEPAGGSSSQPNVSWLNSFDGASGVLKLDFTGPSQGIKLTLQYSEWFSSQSTHWYRLLTRVRSDATTDNDLNINSFLYNGIPTQICDICGHGIISIPPTWTDMRAYLESVGGRNSMYPQLVIRNGNTYPVSIYVDYLIVANVPAPSMDTVSFPGADWDVFDDINYWRFENAPNVNSQATFNVSTGLFDVYMNGVTSQGLKMTMGTAAGVTWTYNNIPGKLTGQEADLSFLGDNNSSMLLLATFGTDTPNGTEIKDLGFTLRINRFFNGNNGTFLAVYPSTQPYLYGQLIMKNGSETHMYLDNMYPLLEH